MGVEQIAEREKTPPLLTIIEDNSHVARSVALLAKKLGFTTEHYSSAESFRQAATATIPKIILLDLGLPGMDGISLLDHIHTHFAASQIIVMSGMDRSIIHATAQLIHARGMLLRGTLHKPFHFKDLKALLLTTNSEQPHEEVTQKRVEQPITPPLLRAAIQERQFTPLYQAQVTSREHKIVGFEAFIRWQHPEWGTMDPAQFISQASRYNLLDAMIWSLLEQIAHQWHQLEWHDTPVTIRIPASYLQQEQLPERISRLLSHYHLDPDQLILAITEEEALNGDPQLLQSLLRLRLDGLQLALHNFGTRFSSLTLLDRLPLQQLKIAQTLITQAESDSVAREMLTALAFLTNRLGIHLIADGIDAESRQTLIRGAGIERIQGDLIHPPMPFEQLQSWREQHHPVAVADTSDTPALPDKELLTLTRHSLPNIDSPTVSSFIEALHMRKAGEHFQPIFATIFQAEETLTALLTLLLRCEWLLLQQSMPTIQRLPDAEQYHAIRKQLNFFEQLRQLAVEVKEHDWRSTLEEAEQRALKEHRSRIVAENSVIWLRRKRVKFTVYLNEVPVQAITQLIDIKNSSITVKLNGELAKVLSIDNYHATIITCDNREQIAVEMLKVKGERVQLLLGEITTNKIAQRHHVRVLHPDQPVCQLALRGEEAVEGKIVDISISGIKCALPPTATIVRDKHLEIAFTIQYREITGRGEVRWHTNREQSVLCGIAISTSSDSQRLLQEETLQLQRELVTQLNNAKLPTLLSNALREMES
ncbi:MAG: EAL domain-containing protein [Mariprofundales bacterium]|nr:EAL domain-containing protein [Mariprofundales bacterium]